MYRVIKLFTDLRDDNYEYHAGDEFPRKGLEVSEERIEELSTDKNRRRIPLIELVKEDEDQPGDDSAKAAVNGSDDQSENEPDATKKPADKPKKGGKKKDA